MFVKQCKATHIKDLTKLPSMTSEFYWSIKYDGHYCQVHVGDEIKFYTSSGKEFSEFNLKLIFQNFPRGIYECEFLGTGDGKLGGRNAAALATTLRTNFAKGVVSDYPACKLVIFDIIDTKPFEERLKLLQNLLQYNNVKVARYQKVLFSNIDYTKKMAIDSGYEGIILKSPLHIQIAGKRVKDAIKVKDAITADVVVIDTIEGDGKYKGCIGALRCKDEKGTIVDVGSGLQDFHRHKPKEYWVGRTIEIKAERETNAAYIHPVYVSLRPDKS